MQTPISTKTLPKEFCTNNYINTFQSDTLILIIDTNDPLNPDMLNYMDRLENTIRQQQNIKSAASIVDILKGANGGSLPQTRAQVDAIVAKIPAETRATAVPSNVMSLVQIQINQGLSDNTKTTALNNVRAVVAASNPPPGVTVTVTGTSGIL